MSIESIKSKLSIIDLASGAGLELKRQSVRLYKAKCIFHNDDKTPSLFFYPQTNTFKCYACGIHGDAINFYAKTHSLTNEEAIKILAKDYRLPAVKTLSKSTEPEEDLTAYTPIYEGLAEFCGELSEESLAYLTGKKRGLSRETVKRFRIFDIKDYKKTKEYLVKHFDYLDLLGAGLIDSHNRFAFIKNKIIIPLIENGKIVCLRGRFYDGRTDDPIDLKTTFTYSKYKSLKGISGRFYNGDILKTSKAGERLYLCEGEFDTMIAEQNGLKAIGLLGVTNYAEAMIKRLKDFDLVLCLDNDEPSRKQAHKIADIFKRATGRDAKINVLPEGIKDITEYYAKKG